MIKNLKRTTVATMAILTILNTGAVFAQTSNNETIKDAAIVSADKLNVRSGPSTSHDIIGAFEKDDDIDLVSIKNGWYKIEMEDGKTGWTNGQYITLDGEITADKLNVRKGPATSYDIVETKGKEETVKIIKADENGWYEVELKDGKTGFVCGKYVETEAKNEHDYSDLYNVSKEVSTITTSTSQSTSSLNVAKTMSVSATAYAGDGITSTGVVPKVGRTIAVDPSVIPYGTKVYIPALGGVYTAEDCGGAIKGNKIDIFMASESECNTWGVRSIEIQILK
ncbi:SH3 domain-containing protein [Intestinibacter sp.]